MGDADGPLRKELHHGGGQAVGRVAGQVGGLRGQGTLHQLHSQGLDARTVHQNGGGILHFVPFHQSGAHWRGVGQAQVHQTRSAPVGEQSRQMVGGRVALGLPVLGHDVADIDLQGVGGPDGLPYPLHQQIGDDTCVEAPRPQEDQVGIPDGPQGLRKGRGPLRKEAHLGDAAVLGLLEGADLGLPHHAGAIFKGGLQLDILVGHGQHPAGDGQDLAHPSHGLVKGVRDAVEGGQEQVAEGLPGKAPGTAWKAVGQELAHHRLHIGQSLHAVPNVPRRGHTQVLPEHAGPAAVVGHGDDGSKVAGILLEAPQHGGQPCPAADGGDPGAVLPARIGVTVWSCHHPSLVMSRWFSEAL